MIQQYLEDLENRINPDVEDELHSLWREFLDDKISNGFFLPRRKCPSPPSFQWPRVTINETIDDPDLMALQQLYECSLALETGSGAIMNVRSNYGTGTFPSVFGAEIFVMDQELNILPTTKPLRGGMDDVVRILDRGAPDIRTGYGEQCLSMGKYFVELFADYPKISRYVHIYHPDLQGPMDVCELLLGSSLFLNLVDNPELVKALLDLITETYIRFMREWDGLISYPDEGYVAHWGMMHKGRIMLRDDSAMNLSPEMFDEFIKPYDQRLLDEFHGGAIHFCGRGDHYIDRIPELRGVYAVNMSQPECNNMEKIYVNTIDKGIKLIGLPRDAAEHAVQKGRELRGKVQCF